MNAKELEAQRVMEDAIDIGAKLLADNVRLRKALEAAVGAYHVIRSMAHDYAKAGGEGPEIRDWNEGERLILEAEAALNPQDKAQEAGNESTNQSD